MILNSLAALAPAALAFAALPAAALAQESEAQGDAAATEEAQVAERMLAFQYEQINYDTAADPDTIWVLDLSNGERVKIRLMEDWAPNHIARIKELTRRGFYDGVIFHRVIEGFMAQGGDPTGTGQGGSELPDLEAEFNPMPHIRGTLAMARAADEDSANSQFFIVFYPRFSLDKRYTNLGRVIENMDAVDKINRGEPPAQPTRILQASLASDNKPPPSAAPARIETDITADLLNAPIDPQ